MFYKIFCVQYFIFEIKNKLISNIEKLLKDIPQKIANNFSKYNIKIVFNFKNKISNILYKVHTYMNNKEHVFEQIRPRIICNSIATVKAYVLMGNMSTKNQVLQKSINQKRKLTVWYYVFASILIMN